MSLWGSTDALASAPKWLTPTTTVAGTAFATTTITVPNHSFTTGDQVTFTNTGTALTGTNVGSGIKYVKVLTPSTIELWGNAATDTDQLSASNTAGTHTIQVTPSDVYFIDSTEATLKANQDKGFDAPGWYEYSTYTDSGSTVRHKAELLCAFGDGNVTDAGDAGVDGDDGDVTFDREITIGATTVTPENPDIDGNVSFTVGIAHTTSGKAGGTVGFQWSFSVDGGTSFADCDVADFSDNTATMTVASGDTDEYVNGALFRCTLTLAEAQTRVSVPVTIVKA